MMPIIKSSQIVGQARPLRALGIVRQKPGLQGEAARAVPQQLKAKGLAGEDQRENEVLSVNGEPGKRVAPGGSELCKEGLSLPDSTNVTLAHDASIDVEDADSRAACDDDQPRHGAALAAR